MDAVSAVTSSSQQSNSTSSASNQNTVDYEAFLKLLVAQLQNQDPTEPTDNAELMSQLASFSSVEQQVQTNTRLDQLIRGSVLGDATGLIGKTVVSADGNTSGEVKSVILADDSITAELVDGSKLPITSGTKITETVTGS